MSDSAGEFELIRRLAQRLDGPDDPATVGIGDDAAAVRQGDGWLLLTCDSAVEGRHFFLDRTISADLGWKLATANVSDIVACGGVPGHALVSLGVPPHVGDAVLEQIYDGLGEAAREYGFQVLGGNVTRSSELIVDLFLTGTAERFVARKGALPGDRIAVSGPLGDSAAGLAILLAGEPHQSDDCRRALVGRHRRPRTAPELASLLASGAHAAIDISDGLSSELHHLAAAGGGRFDIDGESLPHSPELREYARMAGKDPLDWVLHGGEDYRLLVAHPPGRDAEFAEAGFTAIGGVSAGEGVYLSGKPLAPGGWDHLAE